jgi:hypothetical protein
MSSETKQHVRLWADALHRRAWREARMAWVRLRIHPAANCSAVLHPALSGATLSRQSAQALQLVLASLSRGDLKDARVRLTGVLDEWEPLSGTRT